MDKIIFKISGRRTRALLMLLLTLFVACPLLFGCVAKRPLYTKGDTVLNFRNGNTYVIDSPEWMRSKFQVFYTAHDLEGNKVDWLPEISVKKLWKR